MNFILVRRFNYLDLFFNCLGVSLLTQGMIVGGVILLVVGALIAVKAEIKYTPASIQPDYIWQMYARENRTADAIKIYRVMYKATLKEAHDAIVAYLSHYEREM